MKKIFSILLLAFFIGGNFSQGQFLGGAACQTDANCLLGQICDLNTVSTTYHTCIAPPSTPNTTCTKDSDCAGKPGTKCDTVAVSSTYGQCISNGGGCKTDLDCAGMQGTKCDVATVSSTYGQCIIVTTTTSVTPGLADDQTVMGMTIGTKCLLNGQCKFNIYDALGIRTSVRNPGVDGQPGDPTSVGIFVQDIVLSATMFIGTIVTIAIIVSGLMRIFAGASGKDPTKAKSGLINALIGLLIVVSSYLIIRLVQYIAKGF